MGDSDHLATLSLLARDLGRRRIAFLAVREHTGPRRIGPQLRQIFAGPYIANQGFDLASGNTLLAAGEADAVGFGRTFLANPDLPRRFAEGGKELNAPYPQTFYSGGVKGCTDYPALA